MSEFVIESHDLVKDFGSLRAVDHLTVQIEGGEIYGLVGPSGAGKTTLIRMLCGLSSPTAGWATLLGHDIQKERRAVETRMCYMPQESAVYRDITVAENLLFFGRIYGMDRKGIVKRTEKLLSLMEMGGLRRQRADRLSGGERQRLSLACALLHDPELLLLDEPTIGLDPALRIRFWDHFHALNRDGRTILLTTHYLAEAERCGRVGMMQLGRLIIEGTPVELKKKVIVETEVPKGATPPSMEEVFLYVTRRGERVEPDKADGDES